jgi:hypothetical protein
VSTKHELSLGQIITTPQHRDAIHIAVMPVTASEALQPGQRIGLKGYMATPAQDADTTLGIVDPFLREAVQPRQRFWMFLMPNTITSLRHDWTHSMIANDGTGVASESEKWLRDFADEVSADYHKMMAVAATHCEGSSRSWPDYLIEGGRWEGQSTPEEFWTHYKNVTGKAPADDSKPGIFSCSC